MFVLILKFLNNRIVEIRRIFPPGNLSYFLGRSVRIATEDNSMHELIVTEVSSDKMILEEKDD